MAGRAAATPAGSPSGARARSSACRLRPPRKWKARKSAGSNSVSAREQVTFRRLVEDVIDDLHCAGQAGPRNAQRKVRIAIVGGYSEGADLAAPFQLLDRAAPVVLLDPFRVPDVQLLEAYPLLARIPRTPLGRIENLGL
jgi:hypothetical protein